MPNKKTCHKETQTASTHCPNLKKGRHAQVYIHWDFLSREPLITENLCSLLRIILLVLRLFIITCLTLLLITPNHHTDKPQPKSDLHTREIMLKATYVMTTTVQPECFSRRILMSETWVYAVQFDAVLLVVAK
jgi:hypothetical protein